ncbi:saccharopine dehydrogenase NADP-binding domain-containing protein [Streptomyces sp. NPDC020412]|uniref:saccharopine dehydrogenase NADP-binding domain-containing protein n=1 Tax=Streptomyces sp. NPDC020412 TaxID=3365073 RepID=UPI0037A61607
MDRQDGAGRAERPHDIALYGATGFVGELTARYLAAHAPEGCRWALAGRSRARLERLRDRLAADHPRCADLPLVVAAADDTAALRGLAGSARVVATTVGPYLWYGEPLVAACADAGTDYLDLTGEPDLYVCAARIDQAERDLSERELMVTAERGTVKNGAATIAGQYRTHLARYIRELGLSPSSRAATTPPELDDDDDGIFD